MSKKTLAVDSDMIDLALDDLTKLILRLDNNPKKTRKEQNTIKKIQEIRDTIQDSVLYAKLKNHHDDVKECLMKTLDIINLLYGKGFFRPVLCLAFPLYRNSGSGNGTETRDTIYAEDDNVSILYYIRIVTTPSNQTDDFI
jgi:hypothetical protein